MTDTNNTFTELQSLRGTIENLVKDNKLELTGLDVKGKVLEVFKKGLGVDNILLEHVEIGWSADSTGVMLKGILNIEEGITSDTRIKFTPCNGKTAIELTCIFTEPFEWKMENFPLNLNFQVTEFEFASDENSDLAISVFAQIGSAENPIPVIFEIPGYGSDWLLQALPVDSPVTISGITSILKLENNSFAKDFPIDLNDVGLSDLSILYNKVEKKISFISFAFTTTKDFNLFENVNIKCLFAKVTIGHPFESGDRVFDLYLSGLVAIGDSQVYLEALRQSGSHADSKWIFRGTISKINLSKIIKDIAGTFSIELPSIPSVLPDFKFKEISIEFAPSDGSFSFHAEEDSGWDFPYAGVKLSKASFTLSRIKDNKGKFSYPFNIHVEAENILNEDFYPKGIKINKLDLDFNHAENTWTAGGTISADLFDLKDQGLTASYTQDENQSILTITKVGANLDLLQFAAIDAKLMIQHFSLSLIRKKSNNVSITKTIFEFSEGANLIIGDKLDITGNLELGTDTGIVLKFDAPDKPLTISVPEFLLVEGAKQPSIAFRGASIGIIPESDNKNGWRFEGGLSVQFRDFPARIQHILTGNDVKAKMNISKKDGLSVSLNEILSDVSIPLPKIPNKNIQLDPLLVNVKDFTISIDDKGLSFSIDPVLTLPDGLNGAVFGHSGENNNGPEGEIFVTGEEIKSKIAIGIINDNAIISFDLIDSPLAEFKFDKKGFLPLDFSAAGLIKIKVPHFESGINGFSASSEFKEDDSRPLQLPLTIVKNLFKTKFPALADAIPDGLPLLKKPKLLSEDKLDVDKLKLYLENTFGNLLPDGKVPDTLIKVLKHIAAAAGGLPDRLKEYLEADPPNDFKFYIKADPTGSLIADIKTHGSQTNGSDKLSSADELNPKKNGRPIMVLFPALPNLIGLRLSNFQMGPVFGGSLIMVRINAEIDIFDPAVLAESIAASQSDTLKKWFPNSTKAHTTFQIHDLVTFIIYEASGIPIPIPIFYEKLGIDINHPTGLILKASVSFNPLTKNDFSTIAGTVSGLYKFITIESEELKPEEGIQLEAHIGETYIQLPAFLDSRILGVKGNNLASIDFSKIFANFMNGVKFFRLKDVLTGIPLENRFGEANPKFGPIEFLGVWAATTRDEFTKGLKWSDNKIKETNALVGLPDKVRKEILTVLDNAPKTGSDEGVFLLLAGECKIKELLKIGGRFVMVTAGSNGFATGIQIYGDILNNTLGFRINGLVHFDLTKKIGEGAGGFTGKAKLIVNGKDTIEESVTLSDEKIEFSIDVNLFPGFDTIKISEKLNVTITKDGFSAAAKGELKLFDTSMTGVVTVNENSFDMGTELQLGELKFSMEVIAKTLSTKDYPSIQLTGDVEGLSVKLISEAPKQIEKLMHDKLIELLREVKKGRAEDNAKSWWNWMNEKHTQATWAAEEKAITLLCQLTDGTISSVSKTLVSTVISLLPASYQNVLNAIVGNINNFENLEIHIDTDFNTALKDNVKFKIGGKYAGKKFGPFDLLIPFDAKKDAAILITNLARKLAAKFF